MGTKGIPSKGGRPKGVPNTCTKELRAMMEEITPNNEPVPMVLLRMGMKYYTDQDHDRALTAIKGACDFAYPKLKAVELSGRVEAMPILEVTTISEAAGEAEPSTS